MTPRHVTSAVAEVWATSDGRLREFLAERRLAGITARRDVSHFSSKTLSEMPGRPSTRQSLVADYLAKAEEFARALEAKGYAIVEKRN